MESKCIPQDSQEEREKVFAMITRNYATLGYVVDKDSFFAFEASRIMFGLYEGGVLLGSASLVLFSPSTKIPLYELFSEELQKLFDTHTCIAEVGSFVIDHTHQTVSRMQSLAGTRLLFKSVYERAQQEGITLLVIAVNPKHVAFYTMIGFVQFGETKQYSFVQAEAVPLMLDITTPPRALSLFS